ncbi:hypothetical protein [Halorhodospira halophila]|uniref:hypothetical protein n=1 Tax=Halorhodospira halophila TaxID=1053 RepID=UPI0019113FE4|nr:hypothetical protein [Halorhodospira halophila]MBK5935372.1 hypothetical protein [Halorhodospira halophila]
MRRTVPSRLTLHVGFNKTASTWLQKQVFPQLQSVHYAGRGNRPVAGLRRDGVRPCPAYQTFAMPTERWAHRAGAVIDALLDGAPADRPAVVSHERMSSPYDFFGELGKRYRHPGAFPRSLATLQQAAAERGIEQLAILFITRRQDTYLPSFYAERSDRIPQAGQRDFEQRIERRVLGAEYAAYGAFLDYGATVAALREAAPDARITVLPFEWLKADAEGFLGAVAECVGEPEDALRQRVDLGKRSRHRQGGQPNSWRLRPLRGLRGRFQTLRAAIGGGSPEEEITLSDELRERILACYRPANQALIEQLDGEGAERFREHGYV